MTTNDPATRSLTLILRANFPIADRAGQPGPPIPPREKAIGPFTVQPDANWSTEVFTGDTATGTISFTNREQAPVQVTKVLPGGNAFTLRLQTLEAGKRFNLVIATDPGLKAGEHKQTATLVTGGDAGVEIPIALKVVVRPRVFATPTAFRLPGLQLGGLDSELNLGTIYVRKMGPSDLMVKKADSTLRFIRTEVKEEIPGLLYSIRVQVDKSKAEVGHPFRGEIRVKTNDNAVRLLSIPIEGSFNR
ncbi:MAG: hypothetical protein HY650_10235 [Acidobacteria bacterium]|nr:hypothetical protein [Acidobacteriota bacterium]